MSTNLLIGPLKSELSTKLKVLSTKFKMSTKPLILSTKLQTLSTKQEEMSTKVKILSTKPQTLSTKQEEMSTKVKILSTKIIVLSTNFTLSKKPPRKNPCTHIHCGKGIITQPGILKITSFVSIIPLSLQLQSAPIYDSSNGLILKLHESTRLMQWLTIHRLNRAQVQRPVHTRQKGQYKSLK